MSTGSKPVPPSAGSNTGVTLEVPGWAVRALTGAGASAADSTVLTYRALDQNAANRIVERIPEANFTQVGNISEIGIIGTTPRDTGKRAVDLLSLTESLL